MKAEEWLNSKAAKDNSYQGTFGNAGWGAKAQEVLGQVTPPLPLSTNPLSPSFVEIFRRGIERGVSDCSCNSRWWQIGLEAVNWWSGIRDENWGFCMTGIRTTTGV